MATPRAKQFVGGSCPIGQQVEQLISQPRGLLPMSASAPDVPVTLRRTGHT